LDGERCNHDFDFPRWIQFLVGERFNERQPSGNDNLHADGDQCLWLGNGHGNRHRHHGISANDRLLHSKPDRHQFRFRQHAELDDNRSDEYHNHAGNIYVNIGEWFNEREPNGNDDLHADSHQCFWLDNGHGNRHRSYGRGAADDNDHLVSWRNAIDTLHRVYDQCQRRNCSLHFFDEHINIVCYVA